MEIGSRLAGFNIIPLFDMLTETAYVKLMWVKGQTNEMRKVKEMMQYNYAGEITLPKNFNKKPLK